MDVIEAEVFAHLHALEQLAKWNMVNSFITLRDGLRDYLAASGYMKKVATLVLDRMPEYHLLDWQPFYFDVEPTKEEIKMVGPKGQRILSGQQSS